MTRDPFTPRTHEEVLAYLEEGAKPAVRDEPTDPNTKPRTFRDHGEEIAWTLRDMNPRVRRS